MENKKYIYDAFISYRHTELDKFVAETLHRQMEAFKLPKKLVQGPDAPRKKIERVFRDRDELPLASNLEDPIVKALEDSEYLIVICSPRLKESMWCKKEIETFIQIHGRRNVLAVLIEGEPAESFPEELLYDEQQVMGEDGVYTTVRKPIEPLAADFRGKNKKEMKKAMKSEILRLLAPMFNVSYDDLKQRHREQKIRKAIIASTLAGSLGIVFGVYCMATAIHIQNQKKQIEMQADLLAREQASLLAQEAENLLEQDNPRDAVELAYQALTEYQGVKMPATAQAECTLANCMNVYDGSGVVRAAAHMETPGILKDVKVSPSGNYVLTSDNLGNLTVWDISTRSSVAQISDTYVVDDYDFIDDEYFYYSSFEEGLKKVKIADLSSQSYQKKEELFVSLVFDVAITPDRKKIVMLDGDGINVIDTATMTQSAFYKKRGGMFTDRIYVPESSDKVYLINERDGMNYVTGVSLSDGNELFDTALTETDLLDCYCNEDMVYMVGFGSEDLITGKTTLVAVDAASGELKYKKEMDDLLAYKLAYAQTDSTKHLLLLSGSQAVLVDAENGEKLGTYHISEDVAYTVVSDDGGFLLYTENGMCHYIQGSEPYTDIAMQAMICHDVVKLEKTAKGIVGMRENDNRLVVYGYLQNADSSVYQDEVAKPLAEGVFGDTAKQWGQEQGMEKASFIQSYLTMEDANLTLVSFVDGSIALYRTDSMELLNTYKESAAGNFEYYGKMKDYYVACASYTGYLFDKDGALHGMIPSMKGVSKTGDSVVVFGKDEDLNNADIAIPVYTREGLVKKANDYLEKTQQ